MLGLIDIAAILLVATALFAWANTAFLALPMTIGLLVMGLDPAFALIALLAIPLALFARLCAVAVPPEALSPRRAFTPGAVRVLT